MSTLTYAPAEPMSSGEIHTADLQRGIDIEHKHQQISRLLADNSCDALLLQQPANFSWFTSGGDCTRGGSTEVAAGLFITPEARVLLANNVDSGQLFDREIPGLGFQLKERPWHESPQVLIDDLCRGRKVASDSGIGRTLNISEQLCELRVSLTDNECADMRELGRAVAHAVEATARHFKQGDTEAEIAGELSHRLIKHRIIPERLQVWADGQGHRYRHWAYGGDRVERYCVLAVVGRRAGLCVGAARTVSFGELPQQIRSAHQKAMLMQATGMYFSKAGWELFETWSRVERIYEKFSYPDEWQLADQGGVIGYRPCEVPIDPNCAFQLAPNTAVFWQPSVGPAMVGDTVLVGETSSEIITPAEHWPTVRVKVKGAEINRPDILQRDD